MSATLISSTKTSLVWEKKIFFKHVKISVADPDPGGKKASKMYRFIDEF